NVIIVILQRLELGFKLLVFYETGAVVTLIRRNRHQMPAKDDALHPDRVRNQLLDDLLHVFKSAAFAVPPAERDADQWRDSPVFKANRPIEEPGIPRIDGAMSGQHAHRANEQLE